MIKFKIHSAMHDHHLHHLQLVKPRKFFLAVCFKNYEKITIKFCTCWHYSNIQWNLPKGGFPLDEFVRANRIFLSRRIPILISTLISTCAEKPRWATTTCFISRFSYRLLTPRGTILKLWLVFAFGDRKKVELDPTLFFAEANCWHMHIVM